MPSESSAVGGVHQFNQMPCNTPKKGGHGAGVVKHSASTTTVESPTIMNSVPASSGGGTGGPATGIVGPTAATGGAAPGSTNKRGRKPGPLSKSAREAQRRLNHSIIEKARRTKINDALATLKQLVPIDYLQTREMKKTAADGNDNDELNDEEGEDEDLDDDDEAGEEEDVEYRDRRASASTSIINTKQSLSSSSNSKAKGGKKQEKEKEFKLEILVRTVVFLQDLLERVDKLEVAVGASNSNTFPEHCSTCRNAMRLSPSLSSYSTTTTTDNTKKRKREYPSSSSPAIEKDHNDAPHEHEQSRSRVKAARTVEDVHPSPRFSSQRQRAERHTAPSSPLSGLSSAENKRLPSISSWLNNDEHGPILPSPHSFGTFVGTVAGKEGGRNKIIYSPRDNTATSNASGSPSYLPSPPPTTHCFDPIRTYNSTQVPPLLNLGPGATSSSSSAVRSSKSFGRSSSSASGSFVVRPPSSSPQTPLMPTPEDESAASMLLQIASSSSPLFRPINPPTFSASTSSRSRSTTTSPNFPGNLNTQNANALPEPTHFSLYSSHQNSHPHTHSQPHRHPHTHKPQSDNQQAPHTRYDEQSTVRQVETPSSMLGIRKY